MGVIQWTRQPQGPVKPNQGLARPTGLLLPHIGNTVNGYPRTLTGSLATSTDGIVPKPDGASMSDALLSTPVTVGNTTAGALIGRFRVTSWTNGILFGLGAVGGSGGNTLFFLRQSPVNVGRMGFVSDDANAFFQWLDNATGDITGGASYNINDSKYHTALLGFDIAAQSLYCYLDGVYVGTQAFIDPVNVAATYEYLCATGNIRTNTRSANAGTECSGVAYLPYLPSRAFAQKITTGNNFWNLFAPQTRRSFAPQTGIAFDANAGAYSLSGQAATLLKSKVLTAAAGGYSLSGQSATLTKNKLVAAEAGAYVLNGQAANLVYTPAGAFVLAAAAGSYALSGQAAALFKTRVLTAAAGAYSLSGQAATLTRGWNVAASAGAYSVAGQSATLLKTRIVTAAAGAYVLSGQAATLIYTPNTAYTLACASGQYVLSGQNATLISTGRAVDAQELSYPRKKKKKEPNYDYSGNVRTSAFEDQKEQRQILDDGFVVAQDRGLEGRRSDTKQDSNTLASQSERIQAQQEALRMQMEGEELFRRMLAFQDYEDEQIAMALAAVL